MHQAGGTPGLPRALTQASVRHTPRHSLWSLHLHLPTFTYSLSALVSNEPLKTRLSLPLTPKSPSHLTGGETVAQRPVSVLEL